MSAIPNLSNLSNISRLGSVRRPNKKAYLFDGSNDYIAGDTTIGRTGYDATISGNVSTSSDADGSYFWFNGSREPISAVGTSASITGSTGPSITQAASFTCKAKFKFVSFHPTTADAHGIFCYPSVAGVYLSNNAGLLFFRIRNGGTFTNPSTTITTNTLYDAYLVYSQPDNKIYAYLSTSGGASVLLNAGGTTVAAATFGGTGAWSLGDAGIGGGNTVSSSKYIYHAAIRNVALTQAEIDADIALGNTTKTDSRIVAYYIPENLQYNTQYMSNPKDLSNASWTKGANTTVTADYATAPDGTTTADRVQRTALSSNVTGSVGYTSTTITGSTLASKTFIVKAFVRVASGTNLFRLRMDHVGVSTYFSSNQTATTVRQEFTFTQTFTSSTSGTGFTGGLVVASGGDAVDLEVRNVRVFVTNETLRDESPNIGGYIGWKTQKVFSCWCKPGADAANTSAAQGLLFAPWAYLHIRASTNEATIRYDTRLTARTSLYSLGGGFRSRVHIIGCFYRTGSARATKLYVNGVLQDSDTFTVDPPSSISNTVLWSGRISTTYYSGYTRDPRIYTFTGSFTDADALAIYNGLEPSSAGITKYLHWRPTPGEAGTTTIDHAGNSRTGTLTGGVTRPFLSGS